MIIRIIINDDDYSDYDEDDDDHDEDDGELLTYDES